MLTCSGGRFMANWAGGGRAREEPISRTGTATSPLVEPDVQISRMICFRQQRLRFPVAYSLGLPASHFAAVGFMLPAHLDYFLG
jgi:hypothetical protein